MVQGSEERGGLAGRRRGRDGHARDPSSCGPHRHRHGRARDGAVVSEAGAPGPPPTSVSRFALSQVRLLEGPFEQAQGLNLAYLRALEPDRLLAPYRTEAGLEPKAQKYPNWESSGLDGHTAGHYLTARAQASAATRDAELAGRLDYMVAELAAVPARAWQRLRRRHPGRPPAVERGRRRPAARRELQPERQMGALVQPAQAARRFP